MKNQYQKFHVQIKIEGNEGEGFLKIKEYIIDKFHPFPSSDRYYHGSNYLQDYIIRRAKEVGTEHSVQIYIANYTEQEGCFETTFTALVESFIAFGHLHEILEKLIQDVTSRLHSHRYKIHHNIIGFPLNDKRGNLLRSNIFHWALYSISAAIAIILFFAIARHDNAKDKPLEIIIKSESNTPLFKAFDNIIIGKDTLIYQK
jgi:hypothetical protein